MKKFLLMLLTVSFVAMMTVSAYAVPVTFFGEDLGAGEATALTSWANASAAQASFYSNLIGVSTEDFESMSGNVADFGGGLTATLSGGSVATVTPGTTNGVGRYAISGSKYWEVSQNFTLTFSEAISAFGFYGVDIGDFDGQVVLGLANGSTTTMNIGNSTNILGGSVLYFGFYDLEAQYTSISFQNTAQGVDYFGFDDFTIGTINNINPVPEPATMLLLGAGLVGLCFNSRKKFLKK
jgi:hypothetical protein